MSIPSISITYDPSSQFYCPACGTQIISAQSGVTKNACNHFEYLYVPPAGNFEYIKPELKELLDKWESGTSEDEDFFPEEALQERRKDFSSFSIELAHSRGHQSFNVVIGLCLNPK